MAEEWDDNAQFASGSNTAPFVDGGRTYGKGRGFKPLNNNNNNNNNENWGVGSKNGHYKSGYDNNNGNNGNSTGGWGNNGGWNSGSSRGGFNSDRLGHNQGGGRGAFSNRNYDDRENNSYEGRYNDRNGDGEDAEDNKDRNSYGDARGGRNSADDYKPRGGFRGGERGGGTYKNHDDDQRDEASNSCRNKFNGDNKDNNNYRGAGEGRYNDRKSGNDYQSRGGDNRVNIQREDRRGYRNRDEDGAEGSKNFGGSGGGNKIDGDDNNDSRPFNERGGRGRDYVKSDRDDGENRERGEEDQDPDRPPPVTYIPPEISTDDNELFSGVGAGLNFSKYDDIKVTVTGENAPAPIADFNSMGLRSLIVDNIVKSGYTKPTPVQKYAIPIIMADRDLMACAQTGSGKTAAFMVPIINSILHSQMKLKLVGGGCEPHCIVLSPTRELAVQIWLQALKFAKDSIIKCCVIYGGVSPMHQGRQIAGGCHILVATSGRLLDFVERRRVSFASVRYVVFDEADRMLDMGFLPDMRKIMDHESMTPKEKRQTLMFSATFDKQVQHIARDFLHEQLMLSVGIIGGACADVEQIFYQVRKSEKIRKLMDLLHSENIHSFPKTMIFVETKKTADVIAILLSNDKMPSTSIHGDRMQQQREEALRDFRTGRMSILVCTSLAARGLDIEGVAHVINYDMPKDTDEYVHRIGRTGRVGNRGKATSFFNFDTDSGIIGDLVKILRESGQNIPDWLSRGGESNCSPRHNYNNDGSYDNPTSYPNTACNAEPEEEW